MYPKCTDTKNMRSKQFQVTGTTLSRLEFNASLLEISSELQMKRLILELECPHKADLTKPDQQGVPEELARRDRKCTGFCLSPRAGV